MRILIVEDEIRLAEALGQIMEENKYTADIVHDGEAGLDYALSGIYDVIVLDIMMPKKNGMEVLSQIRSEGAAVPVLMLTARSEIEDRVAGLEAGADDYLPKPFATREFIARVKALARRNAGYADTVLSLGNVRLDCNRYELSCKEETVRLNNKEYQLMELFFQHPHFVFSTDHLMDKVWGKDSEADIDVVWTYIGFIRKKLKHIGADIEIKTVRGAGYSLEGNKC